jgi:acetyl esterase
VIPVVPDGAKRLLMGRRAITIDGNTLDPTLQMMLAGQKLSGDTDLSVTGDVATARQSLRRLTALVHRRPVAVGGVTDLTIPGPAGAVRARHYRPEGSPNAPVLVYFHGGGWVVGDLDTHDGQCRLLCRGAGIHVLSVDYRLAPEHPAPAAVEDGYAAFRWALEHGGELGAEPGRVAVGGDSAGGNIAAVIAQRGRDDGSAPALQLLVYPATQMGSDTRSRALFAEGFFLTRRDMDYFEHHYLAGSGVEPADPRVSPLLAEHLGGLAPAIVVTAGFDPLRDEGEQYAAAMCDAGTLVDLRRFGSLIHGFAGMSPLGGGSVVALAEIISALRAHLCYR